MKNKKFKVKWMVREEKRIFKGNDIIELETKPTLKELDDMMDEDLFDAYKQIFPNFRTAIDIKCVCICSDWKVLSVEEIK